MTRGERIIAFIEQFCPVPEGKNVGQPIKLMAFQRKFILDIYDNPKGTSRAYLSVGRKNVSASRSVIDYLAGDDLIAMPERRN